MIRLEVKGDWDGTEEWLRNIRELKFLQVIQKYGPIGVAALSAATPKDSGETASSWDYNIQFNGASAVLEFTNSNVNNGVPIAIILQYGHGTGTGGYVPPRDYINPAMDVVFDEFVNDLLREVTAL